MNKSHTYSDDQVHYLLDVIRQEFLSATKKHAPFPSAHHGYAVILEELDELWEEVKAQEPDKIKMMKEAIQVATTAMRFVADIIVPRL